MVSPSSERPRAAACPQIVDLMESVVKAPSVSPEKWDRIITAKRSWFDLNLTDVWRYRDLIYLFFHRDFVSTYKQTILGPLWFILQPLLTTITFALVFGQIAKMSTSGVPPFIFYMPGIIMWGLFASCLTRCSSVFSSNAGIFSKVYFPRLTVPISSVMTVLSTFGLQFLMFLLFLGFFYLRGNDICPSLSVLTFPLVVLQACLIGIGFGCIISALTTRYRDLQMALTFGMQLWMYGSCVFYSRTDIAPGYRWLLDLNPIVPIIETFRNSFLGTGAVDYGELGVLSIVSIIIFLTGVAVFNQVEKNFADTI